MAALKDRYAGSEAAAMMAAGQMLRRHLCGDWGAVGAEDAAANDAALRDEARVISSYPLNEGGRGRLWVITEADRSVTTFLLPEEY